MPQIRKALDLLRQMSADESIRLLAEEREKALKDEASALASARREGEQIGLEKGEKKKALEAARSLLKMNLLTFEQIAEVTGLPVGEVKRMKDEPPG